MTADVGLIDPADLIDEQGAWEALGLAFEVGDPSITDRYPAMPAPLVDFGPGRPRIWSRRQLAAWIDAGGIEDTAPTPKVVRYVDGLICVVLDPLDAAARREVHRALHAAPKIPRKPRTQLVEFLMAGVALPAVAPGMRRVNEATRRALLRDGRSPVLLPLDGSEASDTMTKTIHRYVRDYLINNPQVSARWPGLRIWWNSSLMSHTDDGPVVWGVAEGGLGD